MNQLSKSKQITGLVGWLVVSYVTAAIGSIASIQASAFYLQLARPDWAPPAFLFGPVWTVLFALIGIAAWLTWRVAGFQGAQTALGLFLLQLVANALWSWLFFAWHQGGLAFVDIVALWLLIVANLTAFWRISAWAGTLLVPYLLWVSFAAALNFSVWQLNPQFLG